MPKLSLQHEFKDKFHNKYYEQCGKFRNGNRFNSIDTIKIFENTDMIKYGVIEFVKDVMFVSSSRWDNK